MCTTCKPTGYHVSSPRQRLPLPFDVDMVPQVSCHPMPQVFKLVHPFQGYTTQANGYMLRAVGTCPKDHVLAFSGILYEAKPGRVLLTHAQQPAYTTNRCTQQHHVDCITQIIYTYSIHVAANMVATERNDERICKQIEQCGRRQLTLPEPTFKLVGLRQYTRPSDAVHLVCVPILKDVNKLPCHAYVLQLLPQHIIRHQVKGPGQVEETRVNWCFTICIVSDGMLEIDTGRNNVGVEKRIVLIQVQNIRNLGFTLDYTVNKI